MSLEIGSSPSRLRMLIRTAALMVLTALAVACSSSSQMSQPGIMMKLLPAYSDGTTEYSLQEASTDLPLVADVQALGLPARFVDARVGGDHSIRLQRLASDVSFDLSLVDGSGKATTIHVHALPPDFPTWTTETTGPIAPGRIYTGVFTGFLPTNYSYGLILEGDGTPVYFRRFDHPAFNFHKVFYADGRVRYVYLDSPVGFDLNKGAAEGDVVIEDQNFNELRRVRLLPTAKHGALPAENHDVLVFDDDHYVLSAYNTRTVDLSAMGGKIDSKVAVPVLQEIRNGSLVWEWDASDYPQLYGASTDGNDYLNATHPVADYLHFNSVDFDPSDGSFILSFRHLDSVVKILPTSVPAGTPIPFKWILGGKLDQFGVAPAQRFYHQHDAKLVSRDGSKLTFSLFDNNNGHYDLHPTAAMVWTIDEAAKTATLDDEYFDNNTSTSQGSVQVLGPRNYFICWGIDNHITEALNGAKVFTLHFADNFLVYRAAKMP